MNHNIFFRHSSNNDRINIRMENFNFFHRPMTGEEGEKEDSKYITPVNAFHQLYNWIRHNQASSGTYLVTGYRGAGKSSFVGMLVRKLREDKSGIDYMTLSVNFGQENIEETEILRIIVKRLRSKLLRRYSREYSHYKARQSLVPLFLVLSVLCLIPVSCGFWQKCWIPFVVFGLLHYVLSRFGNSPVVRALSGLEALSERLHASVEVGTERNLTFSLDDMCQSLGLKSKKNRSMQPATVQEIEYDLIETFNLLKESNRNLRIIIIFDELDKTESGSRPKRPNDLPEFEKLSIRPEQKVSSRVRKQEVLRIIANMKFFLSSAKACFIFIAGREMYEAYQADMSDRDFSISSIFNGVINIDSFLSSSRFSNNSNLKTEQFVCRQILPENIGSLIESSGDKRYDTKNIYCLKNYYRYRVQEGNDFYEDELESGENTPDHHKRTERIWREVLFLYHFVHYLTYISNGSPKKTALFLEKNIRYKTYLVNEGKIKNIYRHSKEGLSPESDAEDAFYLSFGYYTQEKINFIHYLTYPIMQSIINRSNMYGDKLLVSSSFLISHIFKLHNNSFSWRNLEQTPELLEINKTPEIREYIGSIIDFMNHTHLTSIACGLFHYKFPMRISEEISYHSKISGEVSSIFNFSQDEMRSIKEHYIRILDSDNCERSMTSYAQASIHHSLGDIYMLEENYSSAIREYERCMEGVSPILEGEAKGSRIQQLNYVSFMNRTMLKLGLAHEKRRTDNSAFILYEELVDILERFSEQNKVLFNNIRTLHLGLLAQLYVLEKIDTTGIRYDHLEKAIRDFKKIFKNIDKKSLVKADFYRKLGDILYYKNHTFRKDREEKTYNAESFYQKSLDTMLVEGTVEQDIGNENIRCKAYCNKALQIKNMLHPQENGGSQEPSPDFPPRDNHIYHIALSLESLGHISLSERRAGRMNGKYEFDRSFLEAMDEAVKNSLDKINFMPENNMERALLFYWTASRLYNISCERGLSTKCYREMAYTMLAYVRNMEESGMDPHLIIRLMKNIGTHFLISQYRQYEHINLSEFDVLQWMQGREMFQRIDPDMSLSPDIEEFVYIYYTMQLYLYRIMDNEGREELAGNLSRFYKSDIMTGKHPCSTLVSTIQNLKLKARFNEQMLVLLLQCEEPGNLENLGFSDIADYIHCDILDPLIKKTFPETGKKTYRNGMDRKLDLLEFLIVDGLFGLSRILELITPLRNTTLFNNSFKADIYMHLLRFNYLYRLLYCYYCYGDNHENDRMIDVFLMQGKIPTVWESSQNTEEKQYEIHAGPLRPADDFTGRQMNFFRNVMKATRKNNPTNTHLSFLAENAIHYYTKARQMHCQGKSYQEMIRNLFFLDDDLNNDTLQFYMALERFDLDILYAVENKLKKRYSNNELYRIDEYFNKSE